MDYFNYIPSIKVFICKTCHKAEYGSNIRRHLHQFPHSLSSSEEAWANGDESGDLRNFILLKLPS
jgi:hypothetical protein